MRRLAVPFLRAGTCFAALALVASTAEAQMESRRFSVGAHAGGYRFDDAAALKSAAFAGIDALYQFPVLGRIEPGLGFYASVALPTTRYDQFPAVAFDFGDTTFIHGVAQRVKLVEWGVQGSVGTTLGRLRPYVVGGAGFYTIQVDPRQDGLKTYNEPGFQLGGGLNFVVSRTLGFRAEARNSTWTSFDRDRLDATVPYTRDQRIRDVLAPPVKEKSTVNNLRLALVFSYVPGGSVDAAAGGTP